eukprot:NODE_2649_length_1528_cov_22.342349_g2284_i0.p1 GENE.NODE_2649_length_1528_cov_22.342349_g2284_i0~~NODE_2649_length_1528_cov_22.342349_g2284_i0.p1  ORF type:complete len:258 (+),score=18.98 NODE_2649_length_1528_cov_22.342349_g2284_i0:144-917(+)
MLFKKINIKNHLRLCPGGQSNQSSFQIHTCDHRRNISSPVCGKCDSPYIEWKGHCIDEPKSESWKFIFSYFISSLYVLFLFKTSKIFPDKSMIPSQLPGLLQMISFFFGVLNISPVYTNFLHVVNVGSDIGSGEIQSTFSVYLDISTKWKLCITWITNLILIFILFQQFIFHVSYLIIKNKLRKSLFSSINSLIKSNVEPYCSTLISILILSYFNCCVVGLKLALCIPAGDKLEVNYFYPELECYSSDHLFVGYSYL